VISTVKGGSEREGKARTYRYIRARSGMGNGSGTGAMKDHRCHRSGGEGAPFEMIAWGLETRQEERGSK
jgi:hypothetical protein